MIQVILTCTDNLITAFEVRGHAGYADEGQDIYCAGVSAITQTALLGLMKHLNQAPDYQVEKGLLRCSLVKMAAGEMEKAQVILSTMEAGLNSLQDAYPGYIQVIKRRCF